MAPEIIIPSIATLPHSSVLTLHSELLTLSPVNAKKIKLIASAVVVILLGIVIFQNFEPITVAILLVKITMPMAVMLLLTFAIGLLAGWALSLTRSNKNTGSAKK